MTVNAKLGMFDHSSDVGSPRLAGSATFDPASGLYVLRAAGHNMWERRDEFHFVWTRLTGDFAIEARVTFMNESLEKHRKAGCIARTTLEDDSPYADAALHAGDGLTSLQFRRNAGALTEQVVAPMSGANRIRFERHGVQYRFKAAIGDGPLIETEVGDLDLGSSLYVGLFLCSHDAEAIERATFDSVRIERS